jgi:hypothetical protein
MGTNDEVVDELKELLGHDTSVEHISEKEFDPRGSYKQVIGAVKTATGGKVGIFKVELGGTRTEYFVVGVDEEKKRVVGLKALAVES